MTKPIFKIIEFQTAKSGTVTYNQIWGKFLHQRDKWHIPSAEQLVEYNARFLSRWEVEFDTEEDLLYFIMRWA